MRAEGVDLEDGGGPSHDLKVCGRHFGLCHNHRDTQHTCLMILRLHWQASV